MEGKKLNILFCSWRSLEHPQSGGAEIATSEHINGLLERGHDITLVTSAYPNSKYRTTSDGLRIIKFGDQYLGCKIFGLIWYLFINKQRFDLIIDEFHGIPFFTKIYARTKVIVYMHELAQKVWAHNSWPRPFNLIPKITGPFLEYMSLRIYKSNKFITVSESTKKDLLNYGITDIEIIENGINIKNPRSNYKKNKHLSIVYLSAIEKDKGIDDAIVTFSEVIKKIPEAILYIVGKDSSNYFQNVSKLITKLKINKENIQYLGFVSEIKKTSILSQSHLLLFPSIHEGWGLVILEAAACSTPTIAYDVSGVRDAVITGKTGILVDFGNTKKLASEIINIWRNKSRLTTLSREAKKRSKLFDWHTSRKKSAKIVEAYF